MATDADQDQGQNQGQGTEPIDSNAIAQMVNSAVTAQLKRALPKAIEGLLPALADKLRPTGAGAGGEPDQKSPEIAAMAKQLDDFRVALKAAQEQRDAEIRQRRADLAFGELRQALVEAKVRPELVPFIESHFARSGAIVVGDEGQAVLKVKAPLGKGLPEQEQELSIADGVKLWTKTKAAEPFLPAPSGPAGGTVRAPQQGGPVVLAAPKPGATEDEMLEAAMAQIAAYQAR